MLNSVIYIIMRRLESDTIIPMVKNSERANLTCTASLGGIHAPNWIHSHTVPIIQYSMNLLVIYYIAVIVFVFSNSIWLN